MELIKGCGNGLDTLGALGGLQWANGTNGLL
jgi:hypothetical protein